jgi:hypothetical protein
LLFFSITKNENTTNKVNSEVRKHT